MPLRDHFHSPSVDQDLWEGFHSAWANTLVRHLNGHLLPARYRAVPQVHLGAFVEADIATFERQGPGRGQLDPREERSVATASWTPPEPAQTLLVDFPDQGTFEVKVFDEQAGRRLVGVLELVSPGNKDRPDKRKVFAAKCAAYLQEGIGLILIDVITNRRGNLHQELLHTLSQDGLAPETGELNASAYRIVKTDERWHLNTWHWVLTVGSSLPTVPLWLAENFAVPIDLETTYEETCRVLRMA